IRARRARSWRTARPSRRHGAPARRRFDDEALRCTNTATYLCPQDFVLSEHNRPRAPKTDRGRNGESKYEALRCTNTATYLCPQDFVLSEHNRPRAPKTDRGRNG